MRVTFFFFLGHKIEFKHPPLLPPHDIECPAIGYVGEGAPLFCCVCQARKEVLESREDGSGDPSRGLPAAVGAPPLFAKPV